MPARIPAPPIKGGKPAGIRRARPAQHERRLQRDIVNFHGRLVRNPLTAILFAIPNGELRDKATAGMLSGRRRTDLPPPDDAQAMIPSGLGVLPGAPDLVLLTSGKVTLIELKLDGTWDHAKTYQSALQKAFMRASRGLGHDYRVLRDTGEYQALLTELGVPLRIAAIPLNLSHAPVLLVDR